MIRWADKYLAQQHGREPPWETLPGPILPVFPDTTATLDDYHSAREPLEFEYDSEETNPKSLKMTLKRMMPPWVLIQPTSPPGTILIGPVGPT